MDKKIKPIKVALTMQDFEFLVFKLEYFGEYLAEIEKAVTFTGHIKSHEKLENGIAKETLLLNILNNLTGIKFLRKS